MQNQCKERSGQEIAKLKELRAHLVGGAFHIEYLNEKTKQVLMAALDQINLEIALIDPNIDALKMQTIEAIIAAKGNCESCDILCSNCPINCAELDFDKDILRKARRWKAEHE